MPFRGMWKDHLMIKVVRGSRNSTNFGSQENRVLRGIMLIGDWFSTKSREIEIGQLNFQSPIKKPCYSFQKAILNALRYYWIKMSLFLTMKQLIFTCVRIFMTKRLNFYDRKYRFFLIIRNWKWIFLNYQEIFILSQKLFKQEL